LIASSPATKRSPPAGCDPAGTSSGLRIGRLRADGRAEPGTARPTVICTQSADARGVARYPAEDD
jgi:hypothetical protein